MDADAIFAFIKRIQDAYPNFKLTPVLAEYWVQGLRTVAPEDSTEALRRYVYDAPTNFPPTLNRLLDLADAARQDRRRQQYRASAAPVATVLTQAASRAPVADRAWAKEHVVMALAYLNHTLTEADAPAYCHRMAERYPQDARDWRREAQAYQWEQAVTNEAAIARESQLSDDPDLSDIPF